MQKVGMAETVLAIPLDPKRKILKKFNKKMFVNASKITKFKNIFFHE